jgi:NADP-dependent 3-hydroxy acid dehydrogenase YdfG
MSLNEKVAVVTGASSGIGAAIARHLSAAGAKLVLTARRADRLTALAAELSTPAATLAADISDPKTPDRLLQLARERFGRADIIVNNAGYLAVQSIDTIDLEAASQMIRVNYEALVMCSYTFARAFKAQKSGAIINVSSIGAFGAAPMMAVYGGTKHAVEAFTAALRIELAGTGVRVGAIAPGSTETEMYGVIRDSFGAHLPKYPLVQPDDVAASVIFMLQQPDNTNIASLRLYSSHERL